MSRQSPQLDMLKPNFGVYIPITKPEDWTQENYDHAVAMWAAGHSQSEIGRAFGVSKDVINGIGNRFGWSARPSPIKYADPELPATIAILSRYERPPLEAGSDITWALLWTTTPPAFIRRF